jgi:hypothetical protein
MQFLHRKESERCHKTGFTFFTIEVIVELILYVCLFSNGSLYDCNIFSQHFFLMNEDYLLLDIIDLTRKTYLYTFCCGEKHSVSHKAIDKFRILCFLYHAYTYNTQ